MIPFTGRWRQLEIRAQYARRRRSDSPAAASRRVWSARGFGRVMVRSFAPETKVGEMFGTGDVRSPGVKVQPILTKLRMQMAAQLQGGRLERIRQSKRERAHAG